MQEYDIIIVGAGCVGLSMACALPNDYRIALIDNKSLNKQSREHYDLRVFAINRATESFLRDIDVWDSIKSDRLSHYETMHVWDSTGSGDISFDCRDIAEANLGYIIEQAAIYNALLDRVRGQAHITILEEQNLDHLQEYLEHVELSVGDERLRAQLVIAADGANSWCRQQAGIDVKQNTYGHHALVAMIETQKPHQRTARQCFMPSGPLAFLPLDDPHRCSIVWSHHADDVIRLKSMDEKAFNNELMQAFGRGVKALGQLKVVSDRVSFPLIKRHVEQYVKPRIALIGDAAHTIHPLAGQGINLGFADAQRLSRVLNECDDPGDYHSLRRYHRESKSHNQMMLTLMDGFKHLFAARSPVIKQLRNVGMQLSNRANPLKQFFIRQGMG